MHDFFLSTKRGIRKILSFILVGVLLLPIFSTVFIVLAQDGIDITQDIEITSLGLDDVTNLLLNYKVLNSNAIWNQDDYMTFDLPDEYQYPESTTIEFVDTESTLTVENVVHKIHLIIKPGLS